MRPMTLGLLLVLMLSLLAGWWFTNFERVERERYVPYSGEASYNRFFAAESLLRNRGIETDSQASLTPDAWMPDTSDTIVVSVSSSLGTATQVAALQQWVWGGGHLVLLPPLDGSDPEWLLMAMGMTFVDRPVPDDDDALSDDTVFDYDVPLASADYRIEFTDTGSGLDATLGDELGVVIGRRGVQDGVVTMVGSQYYFDNGVLTHGDHARLLLDIVAGYYESGKVWFIYSADFDSLFTKLWRNFPGTVALFVALVLASIIAALPRFGPPVADAPAERRSVVEHVRAAGLFDWRTGRAEGLARSAIDALLHDAEIRHPGIGRLSPEKQAKRLAAITGIEAGSIQQALMLRDEDNARHFTQHMRTLQMTRDRL